MHLKNANDLTAENSKISELISKAKTASKEDFPAIMTELAQEIALRAKFISPVRFSKDPILESDGTAKLPEGTQIAFAQISNEKKEKYYPAFTSVDELMKWDLMQGQKPQTLTLGFDDYAAMILDRKGGDGFVINPFSDNFVVGKEALERWKTKKQIEIKGHIEKRITQGEKMNVIEPKVYPMALANSLIGAAKKLAIKKMWLFELEQNGEKSHLAVVDFTGDRDQIFNALGAAAKPFLNNMDLNMVNAKSSFGVEAVQNHAPIYKA